MVELAFRNRQGGDTQWQMGTYHGDPLEVGVWQVAAGRTLQQAQAEPGNKLADMQLLLECEPDQPFTCKLQCHGGGQWDLQLDLLGDGVVDVDLVAGVGDSRPADLHDIDGRSGLVITAAAAGGVHPGGVGHTDIVVGYREEETLPIAVPMRDRRPLLIDAPVVSHVSPVSISGRRWSAEHGITMANGLLDVIDQTVSGEAPVSDPEIVHLGERDFVARVDLLRQGFNPIAVTQTGLPPTVVERSIAWEPLNVVQGGAIAIRTDDTLLLTICDTCGFQPAALDADGDGVVDFEGLEGDVFAVSYPEPGTFSVTAMVDGAVVGSLSVVVGDLVLPEGIACAVGYERVIDLPLGAFRPEQLHVGALDESLLAVRVLSGGPTHLRIGLTPLRRGHPVLVVREGNAIGPILASSVIEEFTFSISAARTVIVDADTGMGRFELRMRPYLPDLFWNFAMFAGDASFPGGAKELRLATSSSFFRSEPDPISGELVGIALLELEVLPEGENICFRAWASQFNSPEKPISDPANANNGRPCHMRVEETTVCQNQTGRDFLVTRTHGVQGGGEHAVEILPGDRANPPRFTDGQRISCDPDQPASITKKIAAVDAAGDTPADLGQYTVRIEETTFPNAITVIAGADLTIVPQDRYLCVGDTVVLKAYVCDEHGDAQLVDADWTIPTGSTKAGFAQGDGTTDSISGESTVTLKGVAWSSVDGVEVRAVRSGGTDDDTETFTVIEATFEDPSPPITIAAGRPRNLDRVRVRLRPDNLPIDVALTLDDIDGGPPATVHPENTRATAVIDVVAIQDAPHGTSALHARLRDAYGKSCAEVPVYATRLAGLAASWCDQSERLATTPAAPAPAARTIFVPAGARVTLSAEADPAAGAWPQGFPDWWHPSPPQGWSITAADGNPEATVTVANNGAMDLLGAACGQAPAGAYQARFVIKGVEIAEAIIGEGGGSASLVGGEAFSLDTGTTAELRASLTQGLTDPTRVGFTWTVDPPEGAAAPELPDPTSLQTTFKATTAGDYILYAFLDCNGNGTFDQSDEHGHEITVSVEDRDGRVSFDADSYDLHDKEPTVTQTVTVRVEHETRQNETVSVRVALVVGSNAGKQAMIQGDDDDELDLSVDLDSDGRGQATLAIAELTAAEAGFDRLTATLVDEDSHDDSADVRVTGITATHVRHSQSVVGVGGMSFAVDIEPEGIGLELYEFTNWWGAPRSVFVETLAADGTVTPSTEQPGQSGHTTGSPTAYRQDEADWSNWYPASTSHGDNQVWNIRSELVAGRRKYFLSRVDRHSVVKYRRGSGNGIRPFDHEWHWSASNAKDAAWDGGTIHAPGQRPRILDHAGIDGFPPRIFQTVAPAPAFPPPQPEP